MSFENCTCTNTLGLGVEITINETIFFWSQTDDYKKWAKDKPPEFNAFGYLRMVDEREHANRLEF